MYFTINNQNFVVFSTKKKERRGMAVVCWPVCPWRALQQLSHHLFLPRYKMRVRFVSQLTRYCSSCVDFHKGKSIFVWRIILKHGK